MKQITRDPHQCVGKIKFDNHDLAARVAKRRRRNRDAMRHQQPYKCEICGKWHIGATR